MKILLKSVLIMLFFTIKGNAQEVLTLENAVKIALENNYDIKIAKNELKIDQNNVSAGNAGMLPKVAASIAQNNNLQNLSQTRADGNTITLDNAKNNSLNYGVSLDWTIFDGLKMYAKKEQLSQLQKLGEAQLKLTIITRISDVQAAYFNLVQQQQQLAALDSTIVISNQRLKLAQNRFTIGKASKLEVLNAQVDSNTDKVSLLKQNELYSNSKVLLNQLLARDSQINFTVVPEFELEKKLEFEEIKTLAEKQNPQIESLIISKKVAELELKQVKSGRYPSIKINTGYNFAENESSLGFNTQSSARGLNYGFSASLNLFDGFAQKRNEKISSIEIETAEIKIEQQNLALTAQLATIYQSYLTNMELIDLEENNVNIAKQNLVITLDKFHIGTITTIEFRTAQLNYVNAKVRYSDAQFQAKLSEIALKELAGTINL